MRTTTTMRIGEFDVEPTLNRLDRGDETLTVEPRVMDLLMLLAESPGKVFSREEILERVWPETAVQDDALSRAVTLLRRALNDDPKAPRYIETITRRGYRLVAPVSRPDAEADRLRCDEQTLVAGRCRAACRSRRSDRDRGVAGSAWQRAQFAQCARHPAQSAAPDQLARPRVGSGILHGRRERCLHSSR